MLKKLPKYFIMSKFFRTLKNCTVYLFFSYVFWMGDLNFRLVEEFEKTSEEIDRMIEKKDLKTLFNFDQLRYVMHRGEAFSELTEKDPEFPPTFKFSVGSSSYNYK